MADNKPINWAYPFKTAGEDSKEVSDPQIYLDALAKAKDGFYPMGANGLWHGGVHFDDNTAGSLDQSSIRCIADGEVIAYRIDQRYPTTQYGDGRAVVHLPFSTGFVLVRHRLVLPSLPAPTAPGGEPGDTTTAATPTDTAASSAASTESATASEGLTFYSLYMHLLDWDSYKSATAPEPADFLAPTCYAVKSTTNDPLMGLRVRALNDDGTNKVLALLPKGCKVTLGEAHSIKTKYKKLLSIDEGMAIPALPAGTEGWVYEAELTDNTVADKATDTESELTLSHQGVRVRREGKGNGTIIGVLPRGATLKVGEKQRSGYCKVLEVMDYRGVPALPNGADGKPLGYVFFDALETQKTEPSALDSVHILPKPYSIKAGELVGHIGKYQNQDEGTAKKRLHLEVFTSEDVPAFIEKSRAIGEKLPDEQKTLIKVDKGSKIVQPAAADAQVEASVDVRLCSDSPKAGCWAKVQKYAICNADKNSELGSYNSTKLTYTLGAAQKTILASRMGLNAADMPDQVDFLKVYSNSADGGDPHDYESGSIPSTHPWRKIGAVVGKPFWVKRSALNAQGRRTSTAGSLDAWSEFPLYSGLEGEASGYVRILPASSWDALPDERKAIDAEQVRWWYVTVGDMEGNDISGWAPEKDLIVTRHSPWEWPGFSTLQDKVSLDAHLARTLDAAGRATEEETESYAALIEEAERGPILSKLYEIIDQPDEKGVRDNKLTPEEFKAALAKPWLAQQLSLLISQHESEWFWNESKWNQLDKLMEHTPEDPNPQWLREKERIKTLSWWKELAGQPGIAADGMAWHFQPIGLVESFKNSSSCCELSTDKFKAIFGERSIFSAWNMPRDSKAFNISIEEFVELINSGFKSYGFESCLHKAHFLAQCYHESDHFNTTIEYADGMDYDLATHPITVCDTYGADSRTCRRHHQIMAEGNTTVGDGPKYKGRGLIQITWKSAYQAFSTYSGVDCVSNPEIIGRNMNMAINASLWFWTIFKGENLNAKIERYYQELSGNASMSETQKDEEVVRRITAIVNGGDRGLSERKQLFKKIREQLK
uniref:Glycoside hydrolase, family 19 n=1 Tax=Ectopseudomonas mendocina (strain ymp) TaxID=399739 RepID=A4XNG6_ECTM1